MNFNLLLITLNLINCNDQQENQVIVTKAENQPEAPQNKVEEVKEFPMSIREIPEVLTFFFSFLANNIKVRLLRYNASKL